MREAAERAEAGAPEGTLVTADEQTVGRGRLGRDWHSPSRSGLYFSLVLRPPVAAAEAMSITLACGLGVARGIGRTCGRQADIRWPNDVLLGGKKCCGILVDLVATGDRARYAIVGVGVNVNQQSFPPELETIATSLSRETGCEWARDVLLESILGALEKYYDTFLERGSGTVVEAFTRASSYAKGRRVEVESAAQSIRGVTAGLDERGILLVRQDDGVIVPVLAGGVRPLED
jgi:BirA family transcriptional regulator, biotin operon repressor / biotin---[acetyl-CoA-carboxylase] ligase